MVFGEIDRCERCGGLVKRVRDIDQAICRCDRPVRPGKRGRPPSPVELNIDADQLEAEAAVRQGVFRSDD